MGSLSPWAVLTHPIERDNEVIATKEGRPDVFHLWHATHIPTPGKFMVTIDPNQGSNAVFTPLRIHGCLLRGTLWSQLGPNQGSNACIHSQRMYQRASLCPRP